MTKKEVFLYSGPIRNRKSTKCLKHELVVSEGNIYYIARTIRNLEETFDTCLKHLSKEFTGWEALFITGKNTVCPKFEGCYDYAKGVIQYCTKCPEKHRRIVYSDEVQSIINEATHYTIPIIKAISETAMVCPSRMAHSLKKKEHQIVFLTYEGLLNFDITSLDHSKDTIIFDEARNLLSLSNIKQITLGRNKSAGKCLESYVSEIIKTLEYFVANNKIKRLYKDEVIVCIKEFLDYIISTLDKQEAELSFIKDEKKKWLSQFIEKKVYRKEWMHKNKEPIDLTDLRIIKIKKYFESRLAKFWDDNMYKLWNIFDTLNMMHKYNVFLEYIKTEKTLNMHIYDDEERTLVKKIIENSNRVNLIDGTPFSHIFHKVWLGDDFSIVDIDSSIYDKDQIDYHFNIVVIDRQLDMNENTGFQLSNYQRMMKRITGLEDWAKLHDKSFIYFLKSKKHRDFFVKMSQEYCTILPNRILYSRGSEGEGIQRDENYVLNIGLPLQNIDSEEYRKYQFARMCNATDEINYSKCSTIIERYRKEVAYQYLIQQSFRCAQTGKDSGCIWIGIKKEDIMEMMNIYPWLQKVNFIFIRRNIQNDVEWLGMVLDALLLGKPNPLTETEIVYCKAIKEASSRLSEFSIYQIRILCGNTNYFRLQEIIERLVNENILIPIKTDGKLVYKYNPNSSALKQISNI